ncbi:MAG: hypothetical protein HQK52_23860 [Oligoflexia bacterium]|nr:hypothetical protein [Oligoflexia bacterium]
MIELERLLEEVNNCTKIGSNQRQRKYSQQLRDKLIAASSKYSPQQVAQATGVALSTLWMWGCRSKINFQKQQSISKEKKRAIIIKELPPLAGIAPIKKLVSTTALKLTTTTGACLEISDCDEHQLISIVNTFLGGNR